MMIDRLARLDGSETWSDDLNPAQMAALDYLSQANRFSRSPSHVADYLGATRGTVSQTLRTLARKGHITEQRVQGDKRSVSYVLTEHGRNAMAGNPAVAAALDTLPPHAQAELEAHLTQVLTAALDQRGGRSFGLCGTCRHHQRRENGARCALLGVNLEPQEAGQICHEHAAESAA